MAESQRTTVRVLKIRYAKEDSNWTIFEAEILSGDLQPQKLIAKGVLPKGTEAGTLLDISGYVSRSQFSGEVELTVKTAMVSIPEDPRFLLQYACSITAGLGPTREQQIWTAYGEAWEAESRELEAIAGISHAAREAWRLTLDRIAADRTHARVVSFFLSHGCTDLVARKAWDKWGEEAPAQASANCYVLARLPRVGFAYVDRAVRVHFDVGDRDPRRVSAAVYYALEQASDGGSTLHAIPDILNRACELVPVGTTEAEQGLWREVSQGRIIANRAGQVVSLAPDYENETKIYEWMRP